VRPPEICLYVVGSPPTPVEAEFGDFEGMFRRLLARAPVTAEAFAGAGGDLPPDLDRYAGFVITGSPASLAAPEPWMDAGVDLVRWALRREVPLLGVCFGHQLIGAALGSSVIVNPAGWELSTYDVDVLPAGGDDPLFDGVPVRFPVNLCHRDIVDHAALPADREVRVLAATGKSPVQAIAVGTALRGVQFHPEFDAAVTRAYLRNRRDSVAADAEARGAADDHPDRLAERIRDCPLAERVFENFVRHWVC
jgi:GMP synthase (glutamine-hydrolysing)